MAIAQQQSGVAYFGDESDVFYYVPVAKAGYDWVLEHVTPDGLRVDIAVQYFRSLGRLVLVGVHALEITRYGTAALNGHESGGLEGLLIRENKESVTLRKLTPELVDSVKRGVEKVSPVTHVSVHYLGDSLTRR